MDTNIVNKINDSPYKAFFAIAGGGQTFIGDYCNISGASNTVVGAIIPYNQYVFEKFIGGKVDKFASQEGARKLALASYNECIKAGVDPQYAIGIGASSSVVKDNERKGREHRLIVARNTRYATVVWEMDTHAKRTRIEENHIVSEMIFGLLAEGAWEKYVMDVKLDDHEQMHYSSEVGSTLLVELIENQRSVLTTVLENGRLAKNPILPIYCGSFNPLHDGHRAIMAKAQEILDMPVVCEISVVNTDKPSLDFVDIETRVKQFRNENIDYVLTSRSRFVDKVRALKSEFPEKDLVFVVGADTWNRLWDEKYGYTLKQLDDFFEIQHIRFLVFGRKGYQVYPYAKHFRIDSPEAEAYALSYSSTELRKHGIV